MSHSSKFPYLKKTNKSQQNLNVINENLLTVIYTMANNQQLLMNLLINILSSNQYNILANGIFHGYHLSVECKFGSSCRYFQSGICKYRHSTRNQRYQTDPNFESSKTNVNPFYGNKEMSSSKKSNYQQKYMLNGNLSNNKGYVYENNNFLSKNSKTEFSNPCKEQHKLNKKKSLKVGKNRSKVLNLSDTEETLLNKSNQEAPNNNKNSKNMAHNDPNGKVSIIKSESCLKQVKHPKNLKNSKYETDKKIAGTFKKPPEDENQVNMKSLVKKQQVILKDVWFHDNNFDYSTLKSPVDYYERWNQVLSKIESSDDVFDSQ